MTLGSGIDANHSKKYRISSYSSRSWIVSLAKIQFIKEKIEVFRQLFELAMIYKFKKRIVSEETIWRSTVFEFSTISKFKTE